MAFYNFRKIDISKKAGKQKIIDTFINSIYMYDDHLKIVYNGNGKEEVVTLKELESSSLIADGAPKTVIGFNTYHRFCIRFCAKNSHLEPIWN